MKKALATTFRYNLKPSDAGAIFDIVTATGFFTEEEAILAKGLADETIANGSDESGYEFVLAEQEGRVIGYSCYSLILATDNRYDLYWIAVLPELQGQKLGSKLLAITEQVIKAKNGKHVYVETSTTDHYAKTRNFYLKNNYKEVARIEDFYRDNDGKVIYLKVL